MKMQFWPLLDCDCRCKNGFGVMTERQILLLNKMIDAYINCGGDPGGPYWIDIGETFEAISDFASSFHDKLSVQYIPHQEFRVCRVEKEE